MKHRNVNSQIIVSVIIITKVLSFLLLLLFLFSDNFTWRRMNNVIVHLDKWILLQISL